MASNTLPALPSLPKSTDAGLPPPFRWTPTLGDATVTVSGTLPAWLNGELVRTSPVGFAWNEWRAQHWFDAHGIVYGFRLHDGKVTFRQQLVNSAHLQQLATGKRKISSFGTPMVRGFFGRLLHPIPDTTDNTNVNVVPWGDGWLAMTETPHQHLIDAISLQTKGLQTFDDQLGRLNMTAHPHWDAERRALVNVGFLFGRHSEMLVFHQREGTLTREVEGRLPVKAIPYVHSFGLSKRYAVILDPPYRVETRKLLFSNHAYIEHFTWQPETGCHVWKLERSTGSWRRYDLEPMLCFHVVNQFEDGDDVVLDFLAYPDDKVIGALSTAQLAADLPDLGAQLKRVRLKPGTRTAQVESLGSLEVELPSIDYRRSNGLPYQRFYAMRFGRGLGRWQSTLHAIDVDRGTQHQFQDREWVLGEAIVVTPPSASSAEAATEHGVLLSVGTHVKDDRTRLFVLSTKDLSPIAHAEIPIAVPLGFHGSFRAAK